jgi:lipopolysaccharide/colanic/teichoic acid biosynthesis glycosyltransferase
MSKRLFDVVAARPALLLLAPLLLAIALWIRLDSPGPALFRQVRVGRHGVLFDILKFRTMCRRRRRRPPAHVGCDARITRAGRFLRRTSWTSCPSWSTSCWEA